MENEKCRIIFIQISTYLYMIVLFYKSKICITLCSYIKLKSKVKVLKKYYTHLNAFISYLWLCTKFYENHYLS